MTRTWRLALRITAGLIVVALPSSIGRAIAQAKPPTLRLCWYGSTFCIGQRERRAATIARAVAPRDLSAATQGEGDTCGRTNAVLPENSQTTAGSSVYLRAA